MVEREMIKFTGERIVPGAKECEPNFANKMYQEHIARYLFASKFVKDKEVLDVGCGVGYGSLQLAQSGAKRVVAFDSSPDAIIHARSYYNNELIEYRELDAESFKLKKKFDVVVCFELIEHVSNQEQTLEKIREHLKEDGILIISTPRQLREKRSVFHVKELSFQNFHNLLTKYFKLHHYFFQNNHFVSFVGDSFENVKAPATVIEIMKDIYNPEQSDTYICVASNVDINMNQAANVMVVNDESYVKLLEKDTSILRGIEKILNEDVDKLRISEECLKGEIKNLENRLIESQNISLLLRNQIKNLESNLQVEQVELNDIEAKLEARRTESRVLETSLRDDIKRLEDQLAESGSKERSLRNQNKNLEDSLNNIYSSYGWKILLIARNVVNKIMPLGSRRRKIARWSLSRIWKTPSSSRARFQQKSHSHDSRFKLLLSKTIDYYKKYGIRKTISKIYSELFNKRTIQKINTPYNPETYFAQTLSKGETRITRISFLIGCLEGESKRYRVFNLIQALTKKGIECRTFYDINVDKLDKVLGCDLLIIFRAAMSPQLDIIMETFKQKNIPIVFDIDDLVFEPESVRYVDGIRGWSDEKTEEYINGVKRYRQALEKCDFATCTTEFLADRIRNIGKQCFVVPNTINEAQYKLAASYRKTAKRNKKIKIGYLSGTNTHYKDVQEAAVPLTEILKTYSSSELHIVGPLELPQELKKFTSRIVRKPFLPHLDMLKYLAEMDINIAPLEQNNPFTAGKSELKIFEAALFQVSTVASRTDSYSKCILDGINGFLAGSKEEWFGKLSLLVQNGELRTKIGIQAKEDFTKAFYVENVIDGVIKTYENIADSYHKQDIDLNHLDIAWVIPEPFIGSGGHRSIFRAVRNLSNYGHKITLYFTGELNIEEIKNMVNQQFYNLNHVTFIKYYGDLEYHDCGFATHWTTVYTMMRHKEKIRYPFYFVQDYEPMFAPMGTEYIMAENTYKMGLTHITSGPWPTLKLKNKFNAEADYFRFPVDKSTYNINRERTKKNKNIIFFARPEMPRRCYEIGIMALKIVKEKLPDIEITLFGSGKINSKTVPFEHKNLGLLPDLASLATLYRNADLGIVFSTTNPSLVPYEMMACELAVADIQLEDSLVNYENEENVYLLNPMPELMAQEIISIMNNDEERRRRSTNGYRFAQSFPDEEGMGRRIEELIKQKIRRYGN
jgi:glycosyltransferase involved in cell wall biosynthesis/2-polyprenyl-3-methyl-5-hydroxy-6-metoxy-1,4-benzoquinol methylase